MKYHVLLMMVEMYLVNNLPFFIIENLEEYIEDWNQVFNISRSIIIQWKNECWSVSSNFNRIEWSRMKKKMKWIY